MKQNSQSKLQQALGDKKMWERVGRFSAASAQVQGLGQIHDLAHGVRVGENGIRQDKVERAAKTARLIHMGKKLLQSMGESDV